MDLVMTTTFLLSLHLSMCLRWLPSLEQRQHSKLVPARLTAANTAHAPNLPKEEQAIFEQNEEFHVSTSKNPCFLCGTVYFSDNSYPLHKICIEFIHWIRTYVVDSVVQALYNWPYLDFGSSLET